MENNTKIVVIIPAFNEEASIGLVLKDIPENLIDKVIVVDNSSSDRTAEVATDAGAIVVEEKQKGYGKACLTGIAYAAKYEPDVIIFIDGDYSDHPEEMELLVDKLHEGYDMVIGSRALGNAEKGALLPQARYGNILAVTLIKFFFGYQYTDLGPFRIIKWDKLTEIDMIDENFGWTVEMQIKAVQKGLKITEVPVSYRKRVGVSKVTGTIMGTIRASYKILYTIFKYLFV